MAGKNRVIEEEPTAIVSEGIESCPHCGGTLREKPGEEGFFKCANCGKTIVSRVILFKPSEKQLAKITDADAAAFSKNLSKLTPEEYADFCGRLYDASTQSKHHATHSVTRAEENRVEIVACAGGIHDALLFSRNTPLAKNEVEALLKKMKKLDCKHAFFFAAAGFEKGAAEWASDFEEATLLDTREMACLAKRSGVSLRSIERAVKELKKDEVSAGIASLTEAGVFKSFEEGKDVTGKWWVAVAAAGAAWLTAAAWTGAVEGEWKWGETWWIAPLAAIAAFFWLIVARRDQEKQNEE